MSLRFLDGFDYYATADVGSKWTVSSLSIQSTTTRFNVGQAALLSAAGFMRKAIDAQTTWIVGMALKAGGVTSAGFLIELFSFANNIKIADLWLNAGGLLSVIIYNQFGTGTTLCTGTHTLTPNVWYYIEWKFQLTGSTTNLCNTTVRIAGLTECSFTATSGGTTLGATTMDSVWFQGPGAINYWIDDVYILDGNTAGVHDFLGDIRIETLRPNGAGYSTQFTASTGSNYTCVNQTIQDNDATYVSDNTAGHIDSYTMGDLSSTPSNIYAVQATCIARKDDAGAKTFDILTRISSTNYLSSDYSVQDSYNFFTQIMETSPATSVAWTASEVNAMEMGIKLVS